MAFDGNKRHGLSEREAGALVTYTKNRPVDVCMKVKADAFEDAFIRVFMHQQD